MTCKAVDTCARPRARRGRRNTLWVCPTCGQGWVCYNVGSYGGNSWVWGKWPREESKPDPEAGPFAGEPPEWLDMGNGH